MKLNYRLISMMLLAAILACGCGKNSDDPAKDSGKITAVVKDTASPDNDPAKGGKKDNKGTPEPERTEEAVQTPEPVKLEKIKFNPHVYSALLSEVYPQEWWDSFYNMCDALREGKDTFECASQEIYNWCLDITTLAHFFPAAGGKITNKSNDGTKPFKNGIGRIYYKIPVKDFLKRQTEFEAEIENILNTALESDDTDFEKILKLYEYMEANYTYVSDTVSDGAFSYTALMSKQGECDHIASNYTYLLLQVGVNAVEVGCNGNLNHAWTYVVLDGEGYHCDATWALHDENEPLHLWYFLNSEEMRSADNLSMDALHAPMLPKFFVSNSDLKFPATSDRFACFRYVDFIKLDEKTKTLYYQSDNGVKELKYENALR